MIPAFEATFAVPLHCASCVEDVTAALQQLDGVARVKASLATQTITVRGTAAPSAVVRAIQATGRDAILRGSGAPDGAAVSILETPAHMPTPSPVRGLARLVQVAPTSTLIDLTLRGLPPGRYVASVRERGDISGGAASTGGVWRGDVPPSTRTRSHPTTTTAGTEAPPPPRGLLGGVVTVGADGAGSALLQAGWGVWEVVGRGMVVAPEGVEVEGEGGGEGGGVVVGVIARSAGVWENGKTVCSCSGKTVWEERGEQVARGMV
ncbi:hypothetical protein MMC15_005840 [Xylographa vitiligo]|nr:hypothetical protein [Xylographa vitiligo]